MIAECPKCLQKLRPGWRRCPRCKMQIPQPPAAAPPAAADATEGRSGPWAWVAIAGALAMAGVMSTGMASGTTAPAPKASQTVASPQTSQQASRSRRGLGPAADDGTLTAYDALDAKRAGAAAYGQGDMAGALEDYEAAVAASPDDPEARNNLGQLLVRNGRAKDAIPQFDAAIAIDGRKWSYRFNRARAYGLLNLWKEAAAEYRVAADLFPDDHATAYNLGLALMRLPDYQAAAMALEHAVAMAPEETGFLITLGTAYVGAEQPSRARATFEKFLEIAPSDAEAPRVKRLLEAMTTAGQ